ncbi:MULTISPECIES: DUF397 domain-containing protein [unclassified Streptomyces]|uniref:DUF397 domain-containing protein n=1 Tax=unclassified Streptomyces TaxID=2593676 RepID=UPI0008DC5C76|nr:MULTISPECIES: DUF397 domain-containing protein [unclassified Streptomyces]OII70315.1 DUF397 domain-containing protein [Streptomyces sp. CC77]
MKRSRHIVPDASMLPLWRKSSYSGSNNGSCLEVSDVWRKSTHSDPNGGNCLEVDDSARPVRVPVRDSKNPTGPAVVFGAAAWETFVGAVRRNPLG